MWSTKLFLEVSRDSICKNLEKTMKILSKGDITRLVVQLYSMDLNKTCQRVFGDIPNLNHITQFIMIMSSIKPMNLYPFNKRIMMKAEQVNAAMYKYSYSKFQKVFEIEEFEFVFRHILDNHRDRIFKLCSNKEVKNKEIYNQMLDKWVAKFTEYTI